MTSVQCIFKIISFISWHIFQFNIPNNINHFNTPHRCLIPVKPHEGCKASQPPMFVCWHSQSMVYYQAIQQYLIIVIPLFFCLDRGCQFDKTVAKSHWGLWPDKLLQFQNTKVNSSARLPALHCHCRQDLWHSMFPLPAVSQVLLQISTQVPFTVLLLHCRREGKGAVILVWGKEHQPPIIG